MADISRNTWDNIVLVTRDGAVDATWDGKVKCLVYDVVGMAWVAEIQPSTVGGVGGGGDASALNQTLEIAKLTSIDGKLGAIGQHAMAGSTSVVIASDQTVPVSGSVSVSNLPATQAVSGSVSVSNFPATQPVSIASMPSTPVTGTFWQATQPVSASALPLPSGAATSALQSTISGQLPSALGAKTIANSMAVNIASDQIVPTSLAAGTNLVGKVGIDQTTPGTTNGVQVNAALPTGTNSIGQVTANAGTNLSTSALALESGGNLDKATSSSAIRNDLLEALLLEMRAMRMAIVSIATESGRCRPDDFNPQLQDMGTNGTYVN